MSGRPSFQFYPKDWRTDANLRRCSPAARGVWLDVMCVLHDSEEYGLVRYPLKELAGAASAAMPHVRELVDKNVLRGTDKGACEPAIYVPKHGRREGPAVTLVAAQNGPIWYSKRMVKDEYVRTIRGEGSRFGDSPKPDDNHAPKPPFGDGSSSASASASSSSSPETSTSSEIVVQAAQPSAELEPPPLLDELQDAGIPACDHQGVLALWRQHMPTNPQPRVWTNTRRVYLQARWRELFAQGKTHNRDEALAWFARFFRYLSQSAFLTGRGRTAGDRPPFQAELSWVLQPENFAKCIEGKYHPET